MKGSHLGALKVKATALDTGTVVEWSDAKNDGGAWQQTKVDLGKLAGSSAKVQIDGIRGNCWQGDIAIDDVELYVGSAPGPPSPTPAPPSPTPAPPSPAPAPQSPTPAPPSPTPAPQSPTPA